MDNIERVLGTLLQCARKKKNKDTTFHWLWILCRMFSFSGLTRRELIRLAYLLGSDYTEGVKGIGEVYAILILNVHHFKIDKMLTTESNRSNSSKRCFRKTKQN
jgi:hypothetical protein